MGLFQKFKEGLRKTHSKLAHEIRRIITASPKLGATTLDELEASLIAADLGQATTTQIINAVKHAYETQGRAGLDVLAIARAEIEKGLSTAGAPLQRQAGGLTVVSIVGVNGTGKTTAAAKLAHAVQAEGRTALLAACDTFRAAAVEQLKLWGARLRVPVIAGASGADPASVAHDAVAAALARRADYLFIDTAGRLHTKFNLMEELRKILRVIQRKDATAPHEVLLVLDAATGQNALIQAKAFVEAVDVTGICLAKLDGTAKGGIVFAISDQLGVPVRFIGTGEKPEDLSPFSAEEFVEALFQ